jgi:hypothetical protein
VSPSETAASSSAQPRDRPFRFSWPPTWSRSEAARRTRRRRNPVFVSAFIAVRCSSWPPQASICDASSWTMRSCASKPTGLIWRDWSVAIALARVMVRRARKQSLLRCTASACCAGPATASRCSRFTPVGAQVFGFTGKEQSAVSAGARPTRQCRHGRTARSRCLSKQRRRLGGCLRLLLGEAASRLPPESPRTGRALAGRRPEPRTSSTSRTGATPAACALPSATSPPASSNPGARRPSSSAQPVTPRRATVNAPRLDLPETVLAIPACCALVATNGDPETTAPDGPSDPQSESKLTDTNINCTRQDMSSRPGAVHRAWLCASFA